MAKKNYYAVKVGKNVGVYDNWAETSEQVTGFKGAQFKGFKTEMEAYAYIGLPFVANNENESKNSKRGITVVNSDAVRGKNKKKKDFIVVYRSKKTDKERILYVSSLSNEEKNELYSKMTKDEVYHYRKIASDLMERRFSAVAREKEVLDYLTNNPVAVKPSVLREKYGSIDLSITIYTIKAIINVMGESDFSKDDGSSFFNKNSVRYYSICKNYWNKIWWDTDTGVLSKEEIAQKRFSQYHKDCNKVKTIAEIKDYLDKLGIKGLYGSFSLPKLKVQYETNIRRIEAKKRKEDRIREAERIKEAKIREANKRKEAEMRENKKRFYKYINDVSLAKNKEFDTQAKSLNYDVNQYKQILYKTVARDRKIIGYLNEDDVLEFKKKALRIIKVHSGVEYNKCFVIEAAEVLENLIF